MTTAPALPGSTTRDRLLELAASAPRSPWTLGEWVHVTDGEGALLGYLVARPDGGWSVVCACRVPIRSEPGAEHHALHIHWNMVHKRGYR